MAQGHTVSTRQGDAHVEVRIDGVLVAESDRPVLLDETGLPTRYYLPPEDVDFSVLEESEWRTSCPYKGVARYWSFSGTPPAENVAWSYPEPFPGMEFIEGYVCFYDDAAEITVEE